MAAPLWTDQQQWWFNVWTYVITGVLMAIAITVLYGLGIAVTVLWLVLFG